MSGQFKVGEVCIGQNFVHQTRFNGMDCTVIRGFDLYAAYNPVNEAPEIGPGYRVEFANGEVGIVSPHNLRRKQPPAGEESILRMFTAPAPREVEAA